MENAPENQLVFFGCPLDCDEKYDAIQERLHGLWTTGKSDDPLDEVLAVLRSEIQQEHWKELGSIPVPSWLRPKPRPEDRPQVTSESFISFIDKDGCREHAEKVADVVTTEILPAVPCLIGIDHSLTGGVVKAISRHYGPGNISLIVLDSHTDAIPMPVLEKAIHYDMETNPDSVHDPDDPFLYDRPDSYNASSFLHHLVNEGAIDAKNLYILGISDYPDKQAFKIKDSRISAFTNVYMDLKRRGATLVTKKECLMSPKKVKSLMQSIKTPWAYVSVDMDIGALEAVEGVRFRNWKGLKEQKIYKLADTVSSIFTRGIRLAGMDITEIDPRRAGETFPSGEDRTYRIAANIIKKIGLGIRD